MTWNEYYEELIASGCNDYNAANVIGRLMDLYEDYEWSHVMPFDPHKKEA